MSDNLQQITNANASGSGHGGGGIGDSMSLSSISVSSILLSDALGLSQPNAASNSLNPKANSWIKMSECDEFIGPK